MGRKTPVPAPLKAGAAEVDITPPMGTQIAGDIGRYRPAEIRVEPLYAKALVVQSGDRKLCFLSLDLCAVTDRLAERIRGLAAEQFGFDHDAVMVHPVQNHAAPALGHHAIRDECKRIPPELWWLRGGDDRYNPYAVERIMKAVRIANDSLQPVRIGSVSGLEARVAFNRRFVMRDGTVKTHPRCADPNILYAEGPMDPELGVTCISTDALRPVAMLLHYTCHPTHGYPLRYISSGWPGAWADGIRGGYGKDCVPLVLNGCCGNIHHANHLDPAYVDDYRRMGQVLTETTSRIVKSIRLESDVVLDYAVRHVRIPIRKFDRNLVTAARKLLKEHPEPMWKDPQRTSVEWDWMYAVCLVDLIEACKNRPYHEYEIQAFRVGDTAYVGLGGEPFVEGQLRIKLESPVRHTYVAHMANGYVGYVPTRQAFERGGYETRPANWSKLAPEALDMIADGTVKLLKEVFSDKVK